MNQRFDQVALARQQAGPAPSLLSTHKVLRNTYALLAMTLLFSAVVAGAAVALRLPHPGLVVTLIGYFGLLFLTTKLRDSGWGLLSVFGLTGFMGYTLGPIVSHYLAIPNGGQTVMLALGGTGAVFVGLSAYAVISRKDFGFMGKFLFVGMIALLIAMIANMFLQIPALALTISTLVIVVFSLFLLYDLQRIIRGGETNYVMATTGVYLSLFNIFANLLNLLLALAGDRD